MIDELLKKKDRIIPIIGDDCFYCELVKDGINTTVSFQEYIVERLLGDSCSAEEKKIIGSEGYYGMSVLSDRYCLIKGLRKSIKFRREVRAVVKEGVENGIIHLKEDVKEFLKVGKFNVIITTNVFHILEDIIASILKPYQVQSFVPSAQKEGSRTEESITAPTIYKIFGDCDGEFVLTDDDLLKFLHYLNFPGSESGQGANSLVKYIKEKTMSDDGLGNCILMPIGCDSLPNWLFRFLWYPLSPDLLFGKNDDFVGGAWHKYSPDKEFHRFLEEYNFQTPDKPLGLDNGFDPVLLELTKRFQQKAEELENTARVDMNVNWQENNHWDFFISYASEDVEFVTRICEILTNLLHKTVWMDNRDIKLGDRYWAAIQYGIEHSDRCLFVITNAYLSKAIIRAKINDSGILCDSGVFVELRKLEQHFLHQRYDSNVINSYAVPLIKFGTTVSFINPATRSKVSVPLDSSLLEKLYLYDEYKMLRTDDLFANTQSAVIDEDNMLNVLSQI